MWSSPSQTFSILAISQTLQIWIILFLSPSCSNHCNAVQGCICTTHHSYNFDVFAAPKTRMLSQRFWVVGSGAIQNQHTSSVACCIREFCCWRLFPGESGWHCWDTDMWIQWHSSALRWSSPGLLSMLGKIQRSWWVASPPFCCSFVSKTWRSWRAFSRVYELKACSSKTQSSWHPTTSSQWFHAAF